MLQAMTDTPPEQDPGEYTRGERLAGIIGLIFFGLLAAIALDMATGGRVAGAFASIGGGDEPA